MTQRTGIVSYGTYLPRARLRRDAIGAALATRGGKGTRAVAAYDEDSTSMGVEAARHALRAAGPAVEPARVLFATTAPPYLDKTNATAIHAALGLGRHIGAYDMVGSVRSGIGALHAAAASTDGGLVVLSDVRLGLPGGNDELNGGDGAAAFLFGAGDALAEVVASGATSDEFLDRWRVPGEIASGQWEERFGETAYVPLADEAVTDALKRCGVGAAEVDHVVVTGVHPRAARRVAASLGARPEAFVDDLSATIGNTGAAHPGLLLAAALDRAEPGQTILLVVLADGADALVLRTTEHIAAFRERQSATVADQVAAGDASLTYATFLTWRGLLHREPPRRPDPVPPAGPPSLRTEAWKFGFVASRCEACGTRHLPPARVCVRCEAVDQMVDERLADVRGTIATYTVDRLAYSLNPPVVVAVIDFDGGGRYQCEMTDVDPGTVGIGDRVEMTFRRLFTASGVHNYFWKARPVQGEES